MGTWFLQGASNQVGIVADYYCSISYDSYGLIVQDCIVKSQYMIAVLDQKEINNRIKTKEVKKRSMGENNQRPGRPTEENCIFSKRIGANIVRFVRSINDLPGKIPLILVYAA